LIYGFFLASVSQLIDQNGISLSLSAAHLNVNIFPIQFADFYHTRTNIFKGVALDFRFY
jgi:hypothetical protein